MTWRQALPLALLVVRQSVHKITGFAPFKLLTGRLMPGPSSTLVPPAYLPTPDLTHAAYWKYRHALVSSVSAQVKEKAAVDTSSTPRDPDITPYVYIRVLSRKWTDPRWKGPFRVLARTSHAVQLETKGHKCYHSSQLRPAPDFVPDNGTPLARADVWLWCGGKVLYDRLPPNASELNWLNNESFQTSDALSLHSRFLEKKSDSLHNKDSRKDVDSVPPKKKKHEKHGGKKKKYKENSRGSAECSGSECEPIFPSELKRKQETDRPRAAPISSSFSWLDDIKSPTLQPFCVDSKSDASNWTYKSLYRGNVARYRRKGCSSLGLDPCRQEVRWEDAKKKHKHGDKKKGADRYFSTVCRQLLKSQLPLLILPRVTESGDGSNSTPFLPLEDIEGEKKLELVGRAQTSSVNPLGVYDPTTALWLQGKGKQDQTDHHEDPNLETGQDTELVTGQTEEFNRKLREQPENTQLWLKFIRYQDELSATVFGGEDAQQAKELSERRKSSYKAVLEKKLSIAERAVATNPSCVALQRERLRICQELWEPSALAKEWKKLVFLHPNSGPLWKEYLLFTQSYFSNFSVSRVNSAYGKCLSMLSAVRDGSMVSHPAMPGIEEDMLDIFTQQCHFLRQSGHSEKAFSLFQAMIDFTFFKPDSVRQLSTKQQADFFEPFWDSGEARVGELNARGWKAWMVQQERGGWVQPSAEEEEEQEEEEEEIKDRIQPRWKVWLNVESSREAAHWLPWRPEKAKSQSEEDCEDPERQVLFDDIGSSLICLSSSELQLRFLLNFLLFLGLPVDTVLLSGGHPGLLLEDLSLLTQGSESRRPLTSSYLPSLGLNSVGHMTTLQGARKWAGLGKQGEKFVNAMLGMLQPVIPSQHRTVLSLSRMQYEKLKVFRCMHSNKKRLRSQSKISKRIAKSLLKEPDNRSSLAMWREFAHLEWMLGNLEEARKVFSTARALGAAKGLSDPTLCELCLLWAQLEVEDGASGPGGLDGNGAASMAVCVLTRLAEGSAISPSSASQPVLPVAILKARRSYEQALTAALCAFDKDLFNPQDNKKGEVAVREDKLRLRGLVGCYGLFQYLTMGLKAASAVYSQARERMDDLHRTIKSDSGTDAFRSGSSLLVRRLASECEMLAVQQASLLKYHTSVGVIPLATLRDTLTLALTSWPSSAPLWSIYVQVENRYHSAGRARRFFHTLTRDNSSVVPRLFTILAEQQRKQLVDAAQRSCDRSGPLSVLPENGLSNRILGLYESAIGTETGAHCPLLWRMYIHCLVSEGKIDQAKGLFYKALQNIPWVKGLYMDAVQLFPECLQEFADLMTEKELRVRLPLEELDILLED
ncbi:nuclear exosome regulator NRDE2 isoform X2 [Syngnathoides biaculeatus]|uniref:nuclear exosome regulator NRDE2 isoform X2 n=1 Tax=Syngnathoides biaculeatus TaxID=300417 RepID=UPI002ADE87EC|nr:nuclear exosome regulator NRDE2 isoform X2 [Syngnathoides biaculeatus]